MSLQRKSVLKQKLKIVSFDFDGTLAYMFPPVHETIGTILSRHGYPGKTDAIAQMLKDRSTFYSRLMMENKDWNQLPRKERIDAINLFILEELGIKSNVSLLLNAIDTEWFATRELHSDVSDTFRQLKEMNIEIAILAGPSSTVIKEVLGRHRLLDYIVCYATGDIVSPKLGQLRKVDGTAFIYLLEKTKSKPNEAIHVGDNILADGDAAKKLGITPILINRSGREDLKRASGKGYSVVSNLEQFLDLIGKKFNNNIVTKLEIR